MRKYVPGDHKIICDSCGLTYMRSETRVSWKNLVQCIECYDPKHPQLLVKGRIDHIAVDIVRAESENDDDLTFGEGSASEL
mgnify:CR=1 FL=1|tara:strand:- start:4253 stop:4495 length:243 start_codon:yes stop_codon:yes gene_type:complete